MKMRKKEIIFKLLAISCVVVGILIGPPKRIAFNNWEMSRLALLEIAFVIVGIYFWIRSKNDN